MIIMVYSLGSFINLHFNFKRVRCKEEIALTNGFVLVRIGDHGKIDGFQAFTK